MKVRVMSVKQSPLNPLRWLLTLACGHEIWVTAKQRPRVRTGRCPKCSAETEAAQAAGGKG